jgi:acyl-CoA reductase-like NAD-dependent aldehyde dehydrogenase
MAAKRILWGKCMNMGQTCVAPDYVICTKEVESAFLQASKEAMSQWYGSNWKVCPDLARIINKKHFQRLKTLIDEAVGNGAKVSMGGNTDEDDLWIEPTIITDVNEDMKIMQDEIFGPILPIFTVKDEEEAIEFIKNRKFKPLCLYVFTSNKKTQKRFQIETSSGTMAFNDTIVQFASKIFAQFLHSNLII